MGAAPLLEDVRALARRARVQIGEGDGEPAGPGIDAFGLTQREREVLDLLADGRSNGQIAEELFITRKTASVHVSNILGKLGVANRGEATAMVHRLRAAGPRGLGAPRPDLSRCAARRRVRSPMCAGRLSRML